MQLRNIAIIAHVDHGKTTLVDAFLKQNNLFRANQEEMNQEMIMDSGDLEREKGITITAKNASVRFRHNGEEYKLNIIDTPGHADFGGEVERTLHMADGALLIVDAQEGPMPQTKFVLKKALELGLKVILVINKIDKAYADPKYALSEVNDLFLELATDEAQLDFPVLYAIGRDGKAFKELPDLATLATTPGDIRPLLETIVETFPAPKDSEKGGVGENLQMLISNVEFHPHWGKLLVGRIKHGKVMVGSNVVVCTDVAPEGKEGQTRPFTLASGKVKTLMAREGLVYQEIESAATGEIIALAGVDSSAIGATVCTAGALDPLPPIKISAPAVRIKIEPNTSPLLGKEGKFVTAKQLQQRLEKEKEMNISLEITKADDGAGYYVAGRGELQLAILIETLRRESYELQVRRPEVIMHMENGVKVEPREELYIEVPAEFQGVVTTLVSERRGEMKNLEIERGQAKFTYHILTRNLLGLRPNLLTASKGNLVFHNEIIDYVPYEVMPEPYRTGVLVSTNAGEAMEYSLNTIQERGELFIGGGTKVYEGMIIGIHKYENDLDVNCTKEREKSGVRRNQAEITQVALKPLRKLTLEFGLLFIKDDELLEVTPENLRLRKLYLTQTERAWSKRSNLTDLAKKQMGMA